MLHELEGEDTGLDEIEGEHELKDIVAVRGAMIRIQQLERDEADVKKTKRAVADAYDRQLSGLTEQREFLRRSVAAYVERNGTVKLPDVGTAYMARGDAKIEVVDAEAFKQELAAMFTREVFDETAAKAHALEQAIDEGVIVPGTNLVPGGPRLQIRKA